MTEKKTEPFEKKPLSVITIIAAMTASVAAMLIGSLFSDQGTIYGAAIGAGVSSSVAVIAENRARKAHVRARALLGKLPAKRRRIFFLSGLGAGMALICVLAAFFTLIAIEGATGRTVHSNFNGPAQYGTSFGYSTRSPSPAPSYAPSGAVVPSESPSPSSSPSPSGSSPSPSPSATAPSTAFSG
jgi:hypothetical protein